MKILVMNCSHRSKQVTYSLAEQFRSKVQEKLSVDVEILELANLEFKSCCYTADCIQKAENICVQNDDFNLVIEKMGESDGVLFLVPKYWPYPSKLITIMERLRLIYLAGYASQGKDEEYLLHGKLAAMVAYISFEGYTKEIFDPLFSSFSRLGLAPLTFDGQPGLALYRPEEDDEEAMERVAIAFAAQLG